MDIELYYQEKGEGTPLVLLHGNNEDSNYFKHQIDYFSKKYRVIAIDTRGHGKSPRGTAPFTMDQFVEDLNYFLEEKKLNKIILLGFSDGANIAIKFALKYQDKLEALILNGANLDTSGPKKIIQIPIEIGYRFVKIFSKISKGALKQTEMLGLMVNEPNIDVNSLHYIKVPTLVIVGKKDLIKEEHTRLIVKHIKESSLIIVRGNHFIANNNPIEFNEEIEYYLNIIKKD